MTRASLALIALALVLSDASSAHAQSLADYRPENEDWNGLSSFVQLAEHQGASVRFASDVDVGALGDALLVVVYPEATIDAASVADFVRSGGSLFVADDFGRGDTLAAAFGLQRVEPGPHEARFQGRSALPAFGPVGVHPLSEGIDLVVANHPSALIGDGLPVLRFDDGSGLVYDMSLGAGDAVFLADASLLTNLMLPVHDNQRLVQNVLRRACAERPACEIVVAAHDARVGGSVAPEGEERRLDAILAALRELLEKLQSLSLPPGARRAVASLLLLGGLLILMTVFPSRVPAWLARPPRPISWDAPRSEYESALARYDGKRDGSYVLPTAMAKDAFERRFYHAVGLPRPPRGNPAARKVAAERYVSKVKPALTAREREREVQRIERSLARFADLPERGMSATSGRRVDLNAFRRTLSEAQRLLEPLGADEPPDFTPPR